MKTMTKKYFLKLAMTLVVAFIFKGVMGQDPTDILDDYVNAVDQEVLQTVGKPFRLYALPDQVFSPNYDATDNSGRNPLSRWTWTLADDSPVKAESNDNWVEIASPTIGTLTYKVIETFDAFTCSDEGTTRAVQVIDVPYVRFDMTGATTLMGLNNVLVSGCSSVTTAINVLFANTLETGNYNINLNYSVYNATLNAEGNIELGASVPAPTTDHSGYTENSPLVISSTELLGSAEYGLEGTAITVYEFTLAGWNAGISRKSDYLDILGDAGKEFNNAGSYTYYNSTYDGADVLTAYLVVLPEPSTGPIYHIPNDFNAL